jgi:purine-cytosine permease-like protein
MASSPPRRPETPAWLYLVAGGVVVLLGLWILGAVIGFIFWVLRITVIIAIVALVGYFLLTRTRR